MNDQQLLRYSRQILLPQFDIQGQEALLRARVLILGLGGLGSPIAMYLASAGVGELVLADDDRVDLPNLQRQIAHGEPDLGRPKVESAYDTLVRLNSDSRVEIWPERLHGERLAQECRLADVVIDATDNFSSRFAINTACVATATALISGAAIRWQGQVTVFPNDGSDSPCYRCLYPEAEPHQETCAENGIMAPVVGIIGSVQAIEAIKVLTGLGTPLYGRLLLLDASTMEWREVRLRRDPYCPTCALQHRAKSNSPQN